MRIIAVASQRGGCGKTTTAINLAAALAHAGKWVLIVDLDPQACATRALNGGIDAACPTVYRPLVNTGIPMSEVAVRTQIDRLDLTPSNMSLAGVEPELVGASGWGLRLARALKTMRDKYDVCVIDCPSSLSVLTLNALVASTDVLVPVHVDSFALDGTKCLLETVSIIRRRFHRYSAGNLRILLTNVDDKTVLGKQVQQEMRELFRGLVLNTVIHKRVALAKALAAGKPIFAYAPRSSGAAEYARLVEELIGVERERERGGASVEAAGIGLRASHLRAAKVRRPSMPPASDAANRVVAEPSAAKSGVSSEAEPYAGEPIVPDAPERESITPASRVRPEPPSISPEPPTRPKRKKNVWHLVFAVVATAALAAIVLKMMNQPPTANHRSVVTLEDTDVSVTLAGSDPEQGALTYTVVEGPSHGRLSGTPPEMVYTPALNYHGSDSFTFVASDGTWKSGPAIVSIGVEGTNDAPVANSQTVAVEDVDPVSVAVIALTGSDVDGDALTLSIYDEPQHGTLTLHPQFATNGRLSYTPNPGYTGPDSFTFKVSDGTEDSASATVSLEVVHVNRPPVADSSTVTAEEDTPLPIILAATDPEAEPLAYAIATDPANGALEGVMPELRYVPNPNFSGTDAFTYSVTDSQGATATAAVTIEVNPVNDAPAIVSESLTVAAVGRRYTYDVNAADPDEGDVLAYTLIEKPIDMSIDPATGLIQWRPIEAQIGSHRVTVEVTDDGETPVSGRQSFVVAVAVPSPEKATLTVSGGYDQKTQTSLSPGNVRRVQVADDNSWETQAGSYTVYDFSDVPIPAGAKITSLVIYVKHFEASPFPAEKLEWSIGTGWPDGPTSWASMTPSIYEGEHSKGTVAWDIKSLVDTPDRVNALQLQVKNSCDATQGGAFVDCIYAVVRFSLPADHTDMD